MNASLQNFKQQLQRDHSQSSIAFDLVATAPHVFISEVEAESRAAQVGGSKNNLIRRALALVAKFASWLAWLSQASVVRSVGPGKQSLQRYEFENLESRRGGFGNVF